MTTLNLQVGASLDDCEKCWVAEWTWKDPSTYDYVLVGYEAANSQKYGGGMRFLNVTIPDDAIITTAYLTLCASHTRDVNTVKSRIKGEDVDDAAAFSDMANYDGRERTTAIVDWDAIEAWTADTDYNSPEIKTIIQEIVDRDGWASGNDLVIFWDDHEGRSTATNNCDRIAYSYDGSAEFAPKLHIEYIGVAIDVPLATIDTSGNVPTFIRDSIFSIPLATIDGSGEIPVVTGGATIIVPLATIDTSGEIPTVLIWALIPITVQLHSRSATARLLDRSVTAQLYPRSKTVKMRTVR